MKPYLAIIAAILTAAEAFPNTPGISRIFEYRPAPGQFINALPPIPDDADSDRVCQIVLEQIGNDAEGMISLGAFGGYVVFGFDHPIVNVPGEYDFNIFGNAFLTDNSRGASAEPGIVMVAADVNENGIPDDTWYELAGSAYDVSRKNFRITYSRPASDNDNCTFTTNDPDIASGAVERNTFHKQPYWPAWIHDSQMTFEGTRLPANGVNEGKDGAQFWILSPFEWGYADNLPDDKCRGFNIDHAVDGNGNHVSLDKIDFVKVYTAECQTCGGIGETSTEIRGAIDLHPDASGSVYAVCEFSTPRLSILADHTISVSVDTDSDFEIFSADGRKICRGILTSGNNTIETDTLTSGLYILRTPYAAVRFIL